MRENRTYGSEGGVAIAIPTPIEKGASPLNPYLYTQLPPLGQTFFFNCP